MAKTRSQRTLIGRSKNAFYWLIVERTKLQRRTQLQRYKPLSCGSYFWLKVGRWFRVLFPSFLSSSFAERFLEIFGLVLDHVQRGCFLVVVASALTSILVNIDHSARSGTKAQATLVNKRLRQTPIFENKLPFSNSDFRKQTYIFQHKLPFSRANSFIQTPIF